jgi:Fur family ferric uptake transcriptional regulator
MDCNELFEFCDPRLQSIQEMVADIYEFEIKHHSLNMYGHCIRENCPNREASDEGPAATGQTTAKEAATSETDA